MPIVNISVWQGFGEERARQVIRGITDAFVQVGVPAQAVQVVIHETPRSHWGDGGQVAAERPRQSDETQAFSRPERPQRPQRPDRPPRQFDGPRQPRAERPAQPQRPSRPDSRPGSRPRRGGSGPR